MGMYRGRGHVKLQHVCTQGSLSIAVASEVQQQDDLVNHSVEYEEKGMQKQAGRANSWRLRLTAGRQTMSEEKREKYEQLSTREMIAIFGDINHQNEDARLFALVLFDPDTSNLKLRMSLLKFGKRVNKVFEKRGQAAKMEGNRQRRQNLVENDAHLKKASRKLDKQSAPPMHFLVRDQPGPKGEPAGSWTVNPDEVADIRIRGWSTVFRGNVSNITKCVFDFFCKCATFIFSSPDFKLQPVNAQSLMHHIMNANDTAGEMDGWKPEDLKLLHLTAFTWLALMYDRVEAGAHWPDSTYHARASYLVKEERNSKILSPIKDCS